MNPVASADPTDRTLWVYDDGGREAAGFKGSTRDCATRAIAIATQQPYRTVYNDLARLEAQLMGRPRSARNGISKKVSRHYLSELGWHWEPTMGIGTGTRVHVRADELPAGRLILKCSNHLVAMIDGVVHDTHDPRREGRRAVYGYWSAP